MWWQNRAHHGEIRKRCSCQHLGLVLQPVGGLGWQGSEWQCQWCQSPEKWHWGERCHHGSNLLATSWTWEHWQWNRLIKKKHSGEFPSKWVHSKIHPICYIGFLWPQVSTVNRWRNKAQNAKKIPWLSPSVSNLEEKFWVTILCLSKSDAIRAWWWTGPE